MKNRNRGIYQISISILFGWFLSAPLMAGAKSELTFLHISDMHINPRPVGAPAPGPDDRSVNAIGWICTESGRSQEIAPRKMTLPPPSFVIATGDLTEYGVIHTTWKHFEEHFEPLKIPLYLTPGNHDNTWTAMLSIMRERHGGDHYAFTSGGCHFIGFDTATPQEPVPSIDRRTLSWLENHLKTVDKQTPVFMFCHHPLSSGEFAKPYEQSRLLQAIQNHNVVMLLMGHGHAVRHEKWAWLDSVMGGSTFGPNTGYGIVNVVDDRLKVYYRYRDESRPMEVVLEKSIAPKPRRYDVKVTDAAVRTKGDSLIVEAEVRIQRLANIRQDRETRLTLSIDGDTDQGTAITKTIAKGKSGSTEKQSAHVSVKELLPGRHYLRVHGEIGNEPVETTREFEMSSNALPLQVQRARLDAGMKAGPLIIDNDIFVATTAGQIVRLSPRNGELEPTVLHEAGVEILHAPRLSEGVLYIPVAEKGVIALELSGKVRWSREVGSVVYGTPAIDDQRVYVGDLEGNVHAIERDSGKIIWSKPYAQFSIEMPLVLHESVLIFGAWDGFLYAVSCRDGKEVWKSRSPAGHEGGKFTSRYYAGADCQPIVMSGRIVMADRAYRLGWYTLEGAYQGDLGSDIPAIALAAEGRGFFARGSAAGLVAYDAQGHERWTARKAELGRFPIPPTAVGDRVYACSNHGTLYALDAEDGRVLWQYQVTPRLPVMAPVAATEQGVIVVADMDGVVSRLVENRH